MAAEKNIIPVDKNGWWPNVKDLMNNGIEITGAIQEEGDLLIVPNKCFHFGFALVCSSIVYVDLNTF